MKCSKMSKVELFDESLALATTAVLYLVNSEMRVGCGVDGGGRVGSARTISEFVLGSLKRIHSMWFGIRASRMISGDKTE